MKIMARAVFLPLFVLAFALPASAADSPTSVVSAFYTRYLKGADRNDTWMKPYFTPDTYALYQRAEARNRGGDLVLDYDPFNGAQVESFDARIGSPTVHSTSADVPVQLLTGLSKSKAQWNTMHVTVRKIGGHWLIDDFIAYDHGKPFIDFVENVKENLARTPSPLSA